MRRSMASPWLLAAALATLLSGGPGSSAVAQEASEDPPPPLTFLTGLDGEPVQEMDLSQEGYVTLVWTPDPQAAGYRVTDASGRVMYEGRIAQAFLSGMLDGEHQFRVASVDETGEIIREGPQPVSITVKHWSLALTWTLFGIGAVVMLALVVVLVVGSRDHRKAATA